MPWAGQRTIRTSEPFACCAGFGVVTGLGEQAARLHRRRSRPPPAWTVHLWRAVVAHQSGGIRFHTVLLPFRSSGSDDGVLEIAFVAGRLEADLLRENYEIALRGAVLVLLLGLVVWLALQRLVFRPVADLMQGIERVAVGESRVPVPVRSRAELGQVAAAFNRMTERLEEARQRVEAETDRSLELMRRLRQTESLAIAGKL